MFRRTLLKAAAIGLAMPYIRKADAAFISFGVNGSGGYNNLTNWPDATNRPTFSGSTLAWVGPIGGGPSTANDVQQTATLANVADLTVSSSGTITNKNVTNSLTVTSSNVTFRACRFAFQSAGAVVDIEGFTNTTLEDCIIDGLGVDTRDAYLGDNGILRRCNILGAENGPNLQNNNTVIDCWVHDLKRTGAVDPHVDGIQIQSGSNHIVQHNSVFAWDTSCIHLQPAFGDLAGSGPIQVINNMCRLDPAQVRPDYLMLYDNGSAGHIINGANVSYVNNIIEKGVQTAWFNYDGIATLPGIFTGNTDFASGITLTEAQAFGV